VWIRKETGEELELGGKKKEEAPHRAANNTQEIADTRI
jgi:hypothetical protein